MKKTVAIEFINYNTVHNTVDMIFEGERGAINIPIPIAVWQRIEEGIDFAVGREFRGRDFTIEVERD